MKPRLTNSKKWTAIPQDYIQQIKDVFSEEFSQFLDGADLLIEGRIYPEEILLRVGFLEKGRLKQNNFEVSMGYTRKQADAIEKIGSCIDAAASMMSEYFEKEGAVEIPYTWQEFDFGQQKIFVQYSTTNTSLEAKADELLGEKADELVKETTAVEDALEHASEKVPAPPTDDEESDQDFADEDDSDDEEDEADEEDAEPSKPTIFSGKNKKKKDDLH